MGTPHFPLDVLSLTSRFMSCRGLHAFAATLSQALTAALPCDLGALYLYSEHGNVFAPVSDHMTDPYSPGYAIGQLASTGTLKAAVVQRGGAILENDLASSDWAESAILKTSPFTNASVLAAPLLVSSPSPSQRANTIGVMAAIAAGRPHSFTEPHRLFLEQLGAHLGPVLHHILAAEERDTLVAINTRVVVGSMTVPELMPLVKDILQRVIRQDMTGLVRFIHSPQGPWFDILYRDGTRIDLNELRQFPFERMAPAELLATGKPLLITGHDCDHYPERAYIESVGILSCILCPLFVRHAPYGFLAIGSRRRNAFSERDLRLAEQIGIHLSHAIANLTAYEEIRSLKEQLEQENIYLRDEIAATIDIKELVGESAALQKTLKAIEQVAPTDSTVLILGETGTGKELVAQAIHQVSPRKTKPLIRVNCAALPPTLIESELFGHERGAFTHATSRKIGRFELADGGTLFLDEVGDIPLDLQAKLLRVLEAQELDRVGGTQTIRLNVRVLAATNVDLEQAVKAGRFRADLFYRLNVFPLHLPPLRERRDDIPLLAKHFTKRYAAQHRKPVSRIAGATLKALRAYDWPGNVRELQHVIERAVIVAQGPVLTIEGFTVPFSLHDSSSPHTLAEAERSHILNVLSQTNWVLAGRQGAAIKLGMKRSTLQHRMKKLGIRRPSTRR